MTELPGPELAEAVVKHLRADGKYYAKVIDWMMAGMLLDEIRRRGWRMTECCQHDDHYVLRGEKQLSIGPRFNWPNEDITAPDFPTAIARLFLKICERDES